MMLIKLTLSNCLALDSLSLLKIYFLKFNKEIIHRFSTGLFTLTTRHLALDRVIHLFHMPIHQEMVVAYDTHLFIAATESYLCLAHSSEKG